MTGEAEGRVALSTRVALAVERTTARRTVNEVKETDCAGMGDRKYVNTSQQRVLLTLDFLARHPEGAHPIDIAHSLGTLASNTTRDLANLRLASMAVAVDGRWYCTPEFVALLRPNAPT